MIYVRVFMLVESETDSNPSVWHDMGNVEIDESSPAESISDKFGDGEYLYATDFTVATKTS